MALCRQLKSEGGNILDTDRYWNLVHSKEQQGMKFHTLAQDYLDYADQHFRNTCPAPGSNYTVKKAMGRLLLFCVVMSLFSAFAHLNKEDFWRIFGSRFLFWSYLEFVFPMILGLLLIPAFIIGHKNKKHGKIAQYIIKIVLAVFVLWLGLTKIFA